MGLKVGIWEPLWAPSIYHIPTWTLWERAKCWDETPPAANLMLAGEEAIRDLPEEDETMASSSDSGGEAIGVIKGSKLFKGVYIGDHVEE